MVEYQFNFLMPYSIIIIFRLHNRKKFGITNVHLFNAVETQKESIYLPHFMDVYL